MIEVRIITTEGCEGCRIMENICLEAARQINNDRKTIDVILTVTDFKDNSVKQFVNRYQVKDFPATFIIKDEIVKDRIWGTTTKQKVIDCIKNIID